MSLFKEWWDEIPDTDQPPASGEGTGGRQMPNRGGSDEQWSSGQNHLDLIENLFRGRVWYVLLIVGIASTQFVGTSSNA